MADEKWKDVVVRLGSIWIKGQVRSVVDTQIRPVATEAIINGSDAAAETSRDITGYVVLGVAGLAFASMIGAGMMGSGITLLVATFVIMAYDTLADGAEIGMLLLSLTLILVPFIIGLLVVVKIPSIVATIVSGKVRGIGPSLVARLFG